MNSKLEIISIFIFNICLIYCIISVFEWYIHKNLMHNGSKNIFINMYDYCFNYIYNESHRESHIDHHTKTNNNGSVSNNIALFFDTFHKFLLPIGILPIIILVNKLLFGIDLTRNMILLLLLLLFAIAWLYEILWNTIHPKYHRWEDNYNEKGIIENNFIYKYLEKYHMIHHYNKGDNKCNYNIVLPGMDHIMGTYKGCVDNKEFCKKHKFDSPKNIEICKNEEMNIKLPYGIEYCN